MNLKHITRIALLIGLVLAFGCGEEEEAKPQAGARGGRGGPGGRKAAAIPVKGDTVSRADMSAYVETYARLEAERKVSVLARTTGLVEALTGEEGDKVRQGQALVRLNKEELSLRLKQVQAAFEEAKANYQRIEVLHDQRMVSQTEYESTRLRFANAALGLEEAELNLTYTDLTAPISGVITQRLVEIGDLVRGNQEVFVIADLDPLLVRIFVPERRMYQLHPGQEATIAVEALPEQNFTGQIRMISPEIDPESGTVKVTLEVDANGLLKPGMFATVRIITERRPNTLVVPKKALILETDEDDVFIIEEGKVRRAAIELGFIEGGQVEIISGLKEGDIVVTIGHEGLKDGAAVRLAGTPLATSEEGGSSGGAGGWAGDGSGGARQRSGDQAASGQSSAKSDSSATGQAARPDSMRQTTRSQGGGR
ncbi:MAG TPA: efflux RND transporter periplasmic adaptor subunit [Candidatus Latescibacteria bacterium]|nr:efflux RND transporter periplasmic adaptor subunit [Candidatus Handelsmanbacteria bacterium]HIL08354.1 efflux RND transporter periplasmic adaptor subunit [Candidatus Latescibacterota bacterium]